MSTSTARRLAVPWCALLWALLLGGCSVGRASDLERRFPLHRRVAEALRAERPYIVRLSGSNRWSPCEVAVDRALEAPPAAIRCANYHVRDEFATHAAQLIAERRSPRLADAADDDATWASAIVDLAGDPGDQRLAAIARDLAAIAERHPHAADLSNDLAVAELLQYSRRRDPMSLIASLDAIERAYHADSTAEAIRFNRAVIRESFGLPATALEAWRRLGGQSDRSWAGEARARTMSGAAGAGHADSSVGPRRTPGSRNNQQLRELALDTLLLEWADASARRDAPAAHIAGERLVEIGDRLARATSDSSVAHLAAELRAGATLNSASVRGLVLGTHQYRLGEYAAAARTFELAIYNYNPHVRPSPLLDWMQVGLANVRHFQARYGEAERLYAQVERNARTRRDLALEAQVHWGRALSEGRQGQLGISAEEFSEAAALFHRIGEPANEAFMIGQRGDVLFQFGEDNSAFEAKLRALTLQRHDPDPTRRVSTLMAFGQQLRDAGFAHVSLAVYREARAIASRSARPADRAEADVRLARANVAIGARADAAASLEAMRVDTAAVSDSILRARLRMEVWQSEAQLLADSAPRAAIAEYDSVADYFRRRGILFSMPEPLVSAARLRMQRGDQSAAEANLDEAVRAIERQAAYAHDRNVDRTMRAARQATFGALVQLELARGDTAAAFGMAERARANPDVERSRLPENVVYLAYSLLPDRCVLWVATNRSLRAIAVSMDTASLLSHARGFRRAAASPADSARAASESRMLFDLLIAPARREIDRSKEVVVVADGPLSEVPFALLRAADGSRLFERAPLSYMNAVRPPRAATNEMRRVTLVGNPDFDARIFDALPQLPSAEAEVRRLRSMHGDARLISGRLATKRAIVDALSQSELFHFAGHAQLAPSAPELSRLVLARAEGGLLENELTAAEIAALRLERLQLVILSACGTSQANSTRDPSGNGLADAFMTAGVRAVIASAWQADDAATSALMEALHRRLSQGEAPAAALRDAQLELLRRNGSLGTEATWGGFRVFRS